MPKSKPISVLVADDHPVVRRGIISILGGDPGIEVAGEAADGREALAQLRSRPFDVVVLDISMPEMTGLEALGNIRCEQPELAVLVLSVHAEARYALRALRAGAAGYLSKDRAPDELIEAVRAVAGGDRYVTPSLASTLAGILVEDREAPLHDRLSEREFQVMVRLARGMKTSRIAEELCLSPKTVGTYRRRVMSKMGFDTPADATRYAIATGLLE